MKFVEMALHRRCTSVRLSIIQPTRTPTCDGPRRVRGWLVGQWSVSRWCQISHAIQVRRFIHVGDTHS